MKRELKKKEVYAIGNKVLKAVRMSDDEIDRIVSSPSLFESVRKAAETGRPQAANRSPYLPIFRRRLAVFAAPGLVMAAFVGAAGLLVRDGIDQVEPAELEDQVRPIPVPEPASTVEGPGPPLGETVRVRAARTLHRKTPSAAARRQQRHDAEMKDQLGEFQAVTYAGDDEEGRIVRVELPRASLYAMGIDVPVENAAVNIKADLLIGSDGVMKAVRVVKMD